MADGVGENYTLPPSLHQDSGDCVNKPEAHSASIFCTGEEREERRTESIGRLHGLPVTPNTTAPPVSVCGSDGVCDHSGSAKEPVNSTLSRPLQNSGTQARNIGCDPDCNTPAGSATVHKGRASGPLCPCPASWIIRLFTGRRCHSDTVQSVVLGQRCITLFLLNAIFECSIPKYIAGVFQKVGHYCPEDGWNGYKTSLEGRKQRVDTLEIWMG